MVRRAIVPVAFLGAYVLTGLLSPKLAFAGHALSPTGAPTGIAMAAFIVVGARAWPAILVASLLVPEATSGSWIASLLLACGTTVQAAIGAQLARRFAAGKDVFRLPRNVVRFTVIVAPATAAVGATLGVAVLSIWGRGAWKTDTALWTTWWLGDLVSAIVLTPCAVLWATGPWRQPWLRIVEFALLLAALVPTCFAVFTGLLPFRDQHYPLSILVVPFLVWAAFRLGRRESATAVVVVTGLAAYGISVGRGPFATETPTESLLLLQVHAGVWSILTMSLASVVSEHAHTERLASNLAITDPLTGLANFRRLILVLDAEIARSSRTGRPFALAFVDVNGLKRINDTRGHLAGNGVLCRVGDVLRRTSRMTDVPARFGGDEFVVVLPETDAAGALAFARRVATDVSANQGDPRVSIATGVAEYPRDGSTSTELLSMADGALYRSKARARVQRRSAG